MIKFENKDFVHTHTHSSDGSFFDAVSPIKNLVKKAREMGFPALALTDHGNISGWIKFIKECTATKDKEGNVLPYSPIKFLLGCEFYLARKQEWKNKDFQPEGKKGNRHLILIAKNFQGYQNICTLTEKAWIDGFYSNPRIDLELLAKHSSGIICSSACLSSVVNANLLYDRYDKAKKVVSIFKDIFGKDFFLEIMYHGIDAEKYIIPDIIKLSKEMDCPIQANNDVHYIEKNQALSQEVFLCMSTKNCITNPKHLRFGYDEFYLKSAEEMGRIFGDIPEAMYNTVELANRVDSEDITKNLFGGGTRLPRTKIPVEFQTTGDEMKDQFNYLKDLVHKGMRKKGWDRSPKHVEALNKELNDVWVAWENNDLDFTSYFLIKYLIFNFAEKNDIMTGPGRGSAWGSIILHCLGIAYGADPLGKTLWERFLAFKNLKFVKETDFGFEKEVNIDDLIQKQELMKDEEENMENEEEEMEE